MIYFVACQLISPDTTIKASCAKYAAEVFSVNTESIDCMLTNETVLGG